MDGSPDFRIFFYIFISTYITIKYCQIDIEQNKKWIFRKIDQHGSADRCPLVKLQIRHCTNIPISITVVWRLLMTSQGTIYRYTLYTYPVIHSSRHYYCAIAMSCCIHRLCIICIVYDFCTCSGHACFIFGYRTNNTCKDLLEHRSRIRGIQPNRWLT